MIEVGDIQGNFIRIFRFIVLWILCFCLAAFCAACAYDTLSMSEAYSKAVKRGIPRQALSWDCKGYNIIYDSFDAWQGEKPIVVCTFIYDVGQEYLYYIHTDVDTRNGRVNSTRPMRIGRPDANEYSSVNPQSADVIKLVEQIGEMEGFNVPDYFVNSFGDVYIRCFTWGMGETVVDFTDPDSGATVKYRIKHDTNEIERFENNAVNLP